MTIMKSLTFLYLLLSLFFQKHSVETSPADNHIGVGASKMVGAKMYFDGDPKCVTKYWKYWEGPRLSAKMPVKWPLVKDPDGTGTVLSSKDPDPNAMKGLYGSADLVTKDEFRDFRAHVEFLIRKPGGNSGVYLQNRYEIQILDGDSTNHGMAAIINEHAAPYFIYNGVGKWNAYDISFRAARFKDGKLVEQPRVTVYFNGTKIHQDEEIRQVWGGPNSGIDGGNDGGKGITDKPGGLKLQSEGYEVLYRNIWIKKMNFKVPDTDF
jgi:hypothetical protein